MAGDPNINITISVNSDDAKKKLSQFSGSVGSMGTDLRKLGRDMQQVSRDLVQFSSAITGAFTLAFAKARQDVPAVNKEFLSLNNSFQVMANSVATAALPTLQQFSSVMNNLAVEVQNFAAAHEEMVNKVLKISAVTLAFTTFLFVLSRTLKFGGEVLIMFKDIGKFLIGLNPIILTIVGAFAALAVIIDLVTNKAISFQKIAQSFATSGFFGIGNLFVQSKGGGAATSGFNQFLAQFQDFMDRLLGMQQKAADRSIDIWGKFGEGFRSIINSLRDAVFEFGAGVSQSFNKAFDDTIFNAITGKLQGLRSLIIQLGNDIARAFSKFAANEIMDFLVGNKEGRSGIIPGLGGLFGRTSPGGGNQAVRQTTQEFGKLTDNMKLFGRAKDEVIDNFKRLARVTEDLARKMSGVGGAGGAAGGGTAVSGDEATKAITDFNTGLSNTVTITGMVSGGFDKICKGIQKMGTVYAAVMTAMSAVSIGLTAITVAAITPMALALASAWLPAAFLASVATLGLADVIGLAALTAGMSSAAGLVGSGFSQAMQSGGQAMGNISLGNGGVEGAGAEGAIVTRPTIALIGEDGPEALVPLNKTRGNGPLGGGSANVNININEAILNNPSNMRDFCRLLREELARAM